MKSAEGMRVNASQKGMEVKLRAMDKEGVKNITTDEGEDSEVVKAEASDDEQRLEGVIFNEKTTSGSQGGHKAKGHMPTRCRAKGSSALLVVRWMFLLGWQRRRDEKNLRLVNYFARIVTTQQQPMTSC